MIASGSLELMQARVQARHGQRIGESGWQALQNTRDFGALLAAARDTTLRPWLAGLTSDVGASCIEAVLRRQWRATVDEVRGWMPAAWHATLEWCAVLPDLPALQHLARGGAATLDRFDDAEWQALANAAPSERHAVLAASRWAALAGAWAAPAKLGPAWVAEWRRRTPAQRGDDAAGWHVLTNTVQAHAQAFAVAPAGTGDALRQELRKRLRLLMRRTTLQPALALVHLALCALDLERLRGELLRRALFNRAKAA